MNSDEFRYEQVSQRHYLFLEKLLTNPEIAKNFSKGKDYDYLEIQQILDQMIDFWNKYSFGIFVVYKNNEPIGIAGYKYISTFNSVEILYCLDKPYWGKGYASKIANEILSYGLDKVKLKEIYGVALIENANSLNILQKIGLKKQKDITIVDKIYRVFKINNTLGVIQNSFQNLVEIDL